MENITKLNLDLIKNEIKKVRDFSPRIHMIPNIVTANFCADALSAIGAKPIMAMYDGEFGEVISQADGFVANLGQPDINKIKSVKKGIEIARGSDVPIVIDPVGCAATTFRREMLEEILNIDFDGIIKGNYSEIIGVISDERFKTGVDSHLSSDTFERKLEKILQKSITKEANVKNVNTIKEENASESVNTIKTENAFKGVNTIKIKSVSESEAGEIDIKEELSKRVYVATGVSDYIFEQARCETNCNNTNVFKENMENVKCDIISVYPDNYVVDSGSKSNNKAVLPWNVTGTGCMFGALLGVMYAVNPNEPQKAAVVTSMLMKYLLMNADGTKGYATYKNNILDMLSLL